MNSEFTVDEYPDGSQEYHDRWGIKFRGKWLEKGFTSRYDASQYMLQNYIIEGIEAKAAEDYAEGMRSLRALTKRRLAVREEMREVKQEQKRKTKRLVKMLRSKK